MILKNDSNIEIIAPKGSPGPAPCTKLCGGTSSASGEEAKWSARREFLMVEIDISACNFKSTPIITSSLEGEHWASLALGGSTPVHSTKDSFTIYILGWAKYHDSFVEGAPTLEIARYDNWTLSWIAMGFIC